MYGSGAGARRCAYIQPTGEKVAGRGWIMYCRPNGIPHTTLISISKRWKKILSLRAMQLPIQRSHLHALLRLATYLERSVLLLLLRHRYVLVVEKTSERHPCMI